MKTNRTLTVITFLLVSAIAGSYAHSKPASNSVTQQVWFTPNVGSTDMLQLFSNPAQWDSARSRIDVFKFYASQLNPAQTDPRNGQNILPHFVSAQAFSQLSMWGIQIGFEALMSSMFRRITEADTICQTRAWAIQRLVGGSGEAIASIESNGGVVSYIAMDEPLNKTATFLLPNPPPITSCYNSVTEIAEDVAQYISQVQLAHPTLLIGDIEPYPRFSIFQLEQWITALETQGVALPFFHLDVSMGAIIARELENPVDLNGDLQELQSFLATRNIAFGVIFNDGTWDDLAGFVNGQLTYNPDYSNQNYYDNTIDMIQIVSTAIGAPDHILFQSWRESWVDSSTGLNFVRQLPINLPESDTLIFSHTRLINEGLAILLPPIQPCTPAPCCCNTPGDYDHNGAFNIADVTAGITRIFSSGPASACQDESDANGDNTFNIADVTYGIARIFSNGAAPLCGTTGS